METDNNSILDILPTEILIEILSYLDYDDIKMTRFVCKSFEQILDKPFINQSYLKLEYRKDFKLDPNNESCNLVYKMNKRFRHISFNDFEYESYFDPEYEPYRDYEYDYYTTPITSFINIIKFLNLYCDTIVTLRLKSCLFSEEQLMEFLPCLKNLKAFEFGGPNYFTVSSAKVIACLISTVETLTFTTPISINRDVIEKIPKDVVPTITELHLDSISGEDYNIPYWHSGVFAVLKRLKVSLCTFSGSFGYINDKNLIHCLNEIDLKLESLKLTTTAQINDAQFEIFTKLMCGLKHFEIKVMNLKNAHAKMICDNMLELRTLKYIGCDFLDCDCFNYAANLKHLETFEIYSCQYACNKTITEGIAKQLNPTIKSIKLHGGFSNDTLIAVTTNLPNLQSLSLWTNIYFSDELLSLIFDRLRDLKELFISSRNSASDRDEFEPHEVEENLTPPPIPRDVDIRCLTKLKSFSIAGYGEFPGISLDKLAEMTQLQDIEFSDYMQLSKMNVLKVLESCTKLKRLTFRDCNNFAKSDEDKNEIRNAYPSKCFVLNIDDYDF